MKIDDNLISLINQTYLTCLNKNIIFQDFITKPVSNKTNKKLRLFAEADLENLKISYVVEDNGVLISKNIFLEKGAEFIDLIYMLSIEWLDEMHFVIKNKYRGVVLDEYVFHIDL